MTREQFENDDRFATIDSTDIGCHGGTGHRSQQACKAAARYPKDPLQFVGIDSWNRPIFRSKVRPKMHYGCCEILFSCDATEKEVAEKVTEADILYFGTSFGCEPEGTTPNAIKIEWTETIGED